MANTVKFRRGLETNRTSETPEAGEPLWTTDDKELWVGDGSTAGGIQVTSASSNDVIKAFTAAVSVVKGDLCYLNSSAKMAKTDADAVATSSGLLAMATETISADASGDFLLYGELTGETGMTAGQIRYIGISLAAHAGSAPVGTGDTVRVIGYALSSTVLWFDPDKTWVELT